MVRELSCSSWNNQREDFFRVVALSTLWPIQPGSEKDLDVRGINGKLSNIVENPG